jgi:hypothetical protein
MKEISDMLIIQIEVTNICNKSCSNCTRFCGHYTKEKIFFISEDEFRLTLQSLKGFPGMIGMMGGEPVLHPNFKRLCEIFIEERPNINERGLLTNMTNYDENKQFYNETFGLVRLNDHKFNLVKHTPILVSSNSVMKDFNIEPDQIENWINKCWVQNTWSANITPKGGFFCEVAGMLDYLLDGPGGVDVKKNPDWWKLPITDFKNQIDWACNKCGCAMPVISRISNDILDDVSSDNLELLKKINSPKIKNGKYVIYDKGLDLDQLNERHLFIRPKKR